MDYPFIIESDEFGSKFFSMDLTDSVSRNVTQMLEQDGGNDLASLLRAFVSVKKRATGPFQSDLTSNRDDVVLAFLSLILLLIIESIVTTVLLRTKAGHVSNFAFSAKQIIELFRELNFSGIFSRKKKASRSPRRLNKSLIVLCIFILFFTIGLEVSILFLTNPELKSVTNEVASLRILQPVTPEWSNVKFHFSASIKRACEPVVLQEIVQGFTAMNGCVETDGNSSVVDLFKLTKEVVTLKIKSQMHDYGSDHEVTIGNWSMNFKMRVYFTLGDRKLRLMKSTGTSENEPEQVNIIQRQFVAYIFSLYSTAVGEQDPDMNLARLQSLKFSFVPNPGGSELDVLQVPQKREWVKTRDYTMTVTDVLPQGSVVLRVAQQYFRGTAAMQVAPPDRKDLFMEEGIDEATAEVWKETVRIVNWLSLLIFSLVCLVVLFILRCFFKPGNTADIAGVYVKDSVGADLLRSPVELSEDELKYFRVPMFGDETEYMLGAETADGPNRRSNEYGQSMM